MVEENKYNKNNYFFKNVLVENPFHSYSSTTYVSASGLPQDFL